MDSGDCNGESDDCGGGEEYANGDDDGDSDTSVIRFINLISIRNSFAAISTTGRVTVTAGATLSTDLSTQTTSSLEQSYTSVQRYDPFMCVWLVESE